jgi:hypothetical protein
MMKDFEAIPAMSEIKDWIFKAAHYKPYNVAGPKTFHVSGNDDASSDNGQAEYPIMCKITNPNAVGDFVAGSSELQCVKASGTTWNSEGSPTNTATYASYYALQERGGGSSGGQSDRYYALINLNNGTEYTLNGRQFRVRAILTNLIPSDTPTIDGRTLQSKTVEFCDTRETDGVQQVNCWKEVLSYVAVNFPVSWYRSMYYPYTWNVPIQYQYWDSNTDTVVQQTWEMPIAMTDNGTASDFSDDWAVCVTSGAVDVTSDDVSKVRTSLSIDASNDLTDCFNTGGSDHFYYLSPRWGADSTSDQNYNLVRDDGIWMWSDATSDYSLAAFSAVQTALTDVSANADLGPVDPESWLGWFKIANLGYNAKFDPYCDDIDSNGKCNCTDTDDDDQCTLADTYTEPTLSERPYWDGDASADEIKAFLKRCGGKSGANLQSCLVDGDQNFNIDWTTVMECETSTKTVSWVDLPGMALGSDPNDNYGYGCGSSTTNFMGKVRLKKLIKRKNAYDVERPNKMLRLISTATGSSGTGVSITHNQEVFSFQEALALAYLRLVMPFTAKITYDNGTTTLEDAGIYFDVVNIPGRDTGPASGLLRKFLEKGGVIDPAD